MSKRYRHLSMVGAVMLVAGLLPATTATGNAGGPATVAAADVLTLAPVADTTYTQVSADGNNATKTTLASCPVLCEGNSQGERDAFVEFTVAGLPAGATIT